MDALIASAGPLPSKKYRQPQAGPSRPRPSSHRTVQKGKDKDPIDPSLDSILSSTRLPSSFHQSHAATGSNDTPLRPASQVSKIADKKVRAKVSRQDVAAQRARKERDDVDEWINAPLGGGQGGIDVDEDMDERTWRVSQGEIGEAVGVAGAAKKFDLAFENLGKYTVDYTRNGRHLAIASSLGHVATFDWQAGRLHSEIQLRESVRDIKFLHSEAFYAVAQKKYVFIYDQNGVEVHKLKQHIDVTRMEFLPYHYLLVTVVSMVHSRLLVLADRRGHAGYLKYHDTSTGVMLTQLPTHLGSPHSMAQNPHSAIIHLGHSNGVMTMWSPNMTTPHVKLLAHKGPITAIAIDPSESSAGRYCASAGMDGTVKLWDGRMWGKEIRSWSHRNQPTSLAYSGRGILAVGGKSGVSTYRDLTSGRTAPTPYLTLPLPSLTANSVRFCPFDDVLAVGHQRGVSSLLVPGSGEANFDSAEADVYETYSRRREREVRGVLDKIRPELITMDTDFLGKVGEKRMGHEERENASFRQLGRMDRLRLQGKADEPDAPQGDEEDEEGDGNEGETASGKERTKKKMRGKGGSMQRYLAKKRKNVIDPGILAMRQKVAKQKQEAEARGRVERGEVVRETGALARFG